MFLTPNNAVLLGICIYTFLIPEVGDDKPVAADIFVIIDANRKYFEFKASVEF